MFEFLEQKKVILVYIPLAVYWITLLIGTSLPAATVPGIALGDKMMHFAAYFILSVLLGLTLLFQDKNRFLKKKYVLSSLVISSIYGLLDEFHQSFIPGRSEDIFDWVADSIGALAGVLFIFYLLKKLGYSNNKLENKHAEFNSDNREL